MERRALARALTPPVIGAVDHGIAGSLGMILGDEALDPRDHCRLAEAVTGGAVRIILDVEHARQRDAVAGPAAAVREEKGRLRAAGAFVRVGEMVSAADKARARSSAVMAGEVWVLIRRPFCGLSEKSDDSLRIGCRKAKVLPL